MRRRHGFLQSVIAATYRAQSMRPWSHRLAWALSGATLLLLGAGAMVTSTGSSLAVPDWPLAYGQVFPPMVGGILYEHGHRLIAATVGLLTIVTAGWLWWSDGRPWVRWLGVAALAAVIVQGVLGGITVLYLLPKAVSISHAMLAQGFFLLTVFLVQVTAPGWGALVQRARHPVGGPLAPLALATLVALLIELLLGAVVRHFNAGLAIPDFPLAYGGLIPPLSAFPILIHFLHRLGALVVLVLVALTVWQALRRHGGEPLLRWPATLMIVLVVLQIALGGGIIWTQRAPTITTLHLVNGALLIATTGVLTLRAMLLTGFAGAARTAATAGYSAR